MIVGSFGIPIMASISVYLLSYSSPRVDSLRSSLYWLLVTLVVLLWTPLPIPPQLPGSPQIVRSVKDPRLFYRKDSLSRRLLRLGTGRIPGLLSQLLLFLFQRSLSWKILIIVNQDIAQISGHYWLSTYQLWGSPIGSRNWLWSRVSFPPLRREGISMPLGFGYYPGVHKTTQVLFTPLGSQN